MSKLTINGEWGGLKLCDDEGVTRLVAYRLVDARRAMACWNALEG